MDKMKKDMLVGAIVGLLVCLLGSVAYVLVMFPDYRLEGAFYMLRTNGLLPKVITLGTLPNVLVFHLFIRNNHVYKARGVLMAVLLLTVAFAVLKFM